MNGSSLEFHFPAFPASSHLTVPYQTRQPIKSSFFASSLIGSTALITWVTTELLARKKQSLLRTVSILVTTMPLRIYSRIVALPLIGLVLVVATVCVVLGTLNYCIASIVGGVADRGFVDFIPLVIGIRQMNKVNPANLEAGDTGVDMEVEEESLIQVDLEFTENGAEVTNVERIGDLDEIFNGG